MATPARAHAHALLMASERGGPPLADRLARPAIEALAERERAFLHELLLGTLRHRGLVDFALAPLLTRPLAELDAPLRAALRLGAYQLLRLRVPHRAAVHESVELVRGHRGSGLVNAVLRRLAQSGPPVEPDPVAEPRAWLVSFGSLPEWIAQRWLARLGPVAAVARARAFLQPPTPAFRLNPRVPDAERRVREAGRVLEPARVPGAWRADALPPPALLREGAVAVQDEASQLVARLVPATGRLLDACAAPGGKALVLADALGEGGRLVAAELDLRRRATLARLVERWGARNVDLVGADAERPPFRAGFDAVLLDAPCSGLGTLGRHPDIRWRLAPEDLARHAARQARMLRAQAALVRPGGLLVHAVCSLEPEESTVVVEAFLAQQPGFQPERPPGWATGFEDGAYVRTRPEDGCDGFFAALLRRV